MDEDLQHSLSTMFEGIENGLTVKLEDRTLVFHLPTLDDLTEIEALMRLNRMVAYEDFAEHMRTVKKRPVLPKVHTDALVALAGRVGDLQDVLKALVAEPACFKKLLFCSLNPKPEDGEKREENVPLNGIDKALRDIITAGKFQDFITKFVAKQNLGAKGGDADPTETATSDSPSGSPA